MSTTECRTFGHAWESFESTAHNGSYFVKLRCIRCLTERLDELSVLGELYRRRYEYQPSYKDTNRMSVSEWRLQYLHEIKLVSARRRDASLRVIREDEARKEREAKRDAG